MPRLSTPEAPAASRESLTAVTQMMGSVPNLFKLTAQSPAALEAMVSLFGATAKGSFKASTREAIALAVAETNGCDYCLSAHSALAKGAGLSDAAMADARKATGADARQTALLGFARQLVLERGRVSDAGLAKVRAAGISDAEVLETIANVVLNIFTNYVNLVADTEIDFPVVRAGR